MEKKLFSLKYSVRAT